MRWLLVLLMSVPALARDPDGRYAQSPNKEWFNGLSSAKGGNCCSMADGLRIEAPDWTCADEDHCTVKIEGGWIEVDAGHIVRSTNRVGYAIVWPFKDSSGQWVVRCFMPGTLS